MKKLKKIVSLILAAALCMSLSFTAFAADECSITIKNSVKGNIYYAYQIFDATYDSDSGAVSYTMDTDSAWSSLILGDGNKYFDAQPVYEAGYDKDSPDADEHISYYNITKADNASDADLISWLTGCIESIDENGIATLSNAETIRPAKDGVEGNDGTITIKGLKPGYYFVSTANEGSVVSVTTAAPNATIIDKNQTPGELHKYIVSDNDNVQADDAGMGKIVNFDITAHVPLYDGENVVTEYVFTDTLSNGMLIELTEQQFHEEQVTVEGVESTIYVLNDYMINSWITLGGSKDPSFTSSVYDYTFELLGHDTYTDEITGETFHTFTGFVLTYYTYDTDAYDPEAVDPESTFDTAKYPIDADIEIQYTAHVTSLEGYVNTNDIEMMWYVTSWDTPTPEDSKPGIDTAQKDHNDVYSWELELVKVDGENETPLEGAVFTLESENMKSVAVGHTYAYVHEDVLAAAEGTIEIERKIYNVLDFESTDYYLLKGGDYTVNVPTEETIGSYDENFGPYHRILIDKQIKVTEEKHIAEGTTDKEGKLYFAGLGSGDYVLTELYAPDGYNVLSAPISFTIEWTEEAGFSVKIDSEGVTTNMSDGYVLKMTVKNNKGAILPGTGGRGTTIFYVIGFIVVAGAAVLLVTRRRLNNAD